NAVETEWPADGILRVVSSRFPAARNRSKRKRPVHSSAPESGARDAGPILDGPEEIYAWREKEAAGRRFFEMDSSNEKCSLFKCILHFRMQSDHIQQLIRELKRVVLCSNLLFLQTTSIRFRIKDRGKRLLNTVGYSKRPRHFSHPS